MSAEKVFSFDTRSRAITRFIHAGCRSVVEMSRGVWTGEPPPVAPPVAERAVSLASAPAASFAFMAADPFYSAMGSSVDDDDDEGCLDAARDASPAPQRAQPPSAKLPRVVHGQGKQSKPLPRIMLGKSVPAPPSAVLGRPAAQAPAALGKAPPAPAAVARVHPTPATRALAPLFTPGFGKLGAGSAKPVGAGRPAPTGVVLNAKTGECVFRKRDGTERPHPPL